MPRKRSPEYKKRHRKNRAIRARIRRSEWLKTHGPCVKCGSWDRLELDHIIPHGLNNIKPISQDMWDWSAQRLADELTKCQPLCWSCHRTKSALERRKYEHGLNLYERHGCRCQICKQASAQKKRIQRQRKHSQGIPWSKIS